MPTYVYACEACGAQFEQFQRFSDEPLNTCPCGKAGQVRRVFQPVGIVFKGSGWYVTDSRNSTASGANGATKAETDTAETKTEAKPETKTEAKPETKAAEPAKPVAS